MVVTIDGANSFNWIIGPASQCVLLVGEETRIAALIQRALVALKNQGPLLNVARQKLSAEHKPTTAIDNLIAEQRGLERWAGELVASDYDPINRHGIIGLWVSVEVAVEDTATLILIKEPSTIQNMKSIGVKLPESLSCPLTEVEARRLYGRLERFVRDKKQLGVAEGYVHLLSTLEVSFDIPRDVALTLSELNYMRNCLLHRGGTVDDRVLAEAPSLGLSAGDKIRIPSARYLHYFDAVACFAKSLLAGALKSRYVRVK